jgi:hypothetical protein
LLLTKREALGVRWASAEAGDITAVTGWAGTAVNGRGPGTGTDASGVIRRVADESATGVACVAIG